MSLVKEREQWLEEFKIGIVDLPLLATYKANRASNSWRSTHSLEKICEYVIYLEGELKNK